MVQIGRIPTILQKMSSIFVEINPQSLFRFLFPFLLVDIAAAAPHAGANGAGPYLGRRIRALNRGQPVCHVYMFFLAVRSGARSVPPRDARSSAPSRLLPILGRLSRSPRADGSASSVVSRASSSTTRGPGEPRARRRREQLWRM